MDTPAFEPDESFAARAQSSLWRTCADRRQPSPVVRHGQAGLLLINLIDDARGTTLSFLAEEETTEAVMRATWMWIERCGLPKALYADRKNVFFADRESTLEEQLADETPMAAFGAACAKLDIHLEKVHSPHAKGCVECNHGVYQDRFVKELALRRPPWTPPTGSWPTDSSTRSTRASPKPPKATRISTAHLNNSTALCPGIPKNPWTTSSAFVCLRFWPSLVHENQ